MFLKVIKDVLVFEHLADSLQKSFEIALVPDTVVKNSWPQLVMSCAVNRTRYKIPSVKRDLVDD